MKEENDILKQINHNDGMTVPDGFFADFATRMSQNLEPTEFELSAAPDFKPKPLTLWQRVRPYVYLAAMFAGIWCMLKMFIAITGTDNTLTPSPTLAEAINDDKFMEYYVIDDIDRFDLMDELIDEGFDFEQLNLDDDDPTIDIDDYNLNDTK